MTTKYPFVDGFTAPDAVVGKPWNNFVLDTHVTKGNTDIGEAQDNYKFATGDLVADAPASGTAKVSGTIKLDGTSQTLTVNCNPWLLNRMQ